ncbi:MAG: hypothetical protein ACI9L6_001336 [Flavobacterium sp.]|jgi:hypothetical protein
MILKRQIVLPLPPFDIGITHFDLANNYDLILCSAGKNLGKIHK